MTLILSLGNSDQVVQVSDRRLSANGKIIDDDSNKATCLVCQNGRFAVGYTGLATYGSFKTQDWLLETLFACASPDYAIYETIERFASRASQDFKQIPSLKNLPAVYKRLSIMLTGYLTHRHRPLIGNLVVTNFQDYAAGYDYPEAKDEFWIASELEEDEISPDITLVQRIGAWQAMMPEDENIIRELLRHRTPQGILLDKVARLVRQIADRPSAAGVIGKNLIATIVPSDINSPCVSIVKQNEAKDIIAFADNLILLGPEDSIVAKEAKVIIKDLPASVSDKGLKKEFNEVRKRRVRHKRHK